MSDATSNLLDFQLHKITGDINYANINIAIPKLVVKKSKIDKKLNARGGESYRDINLNEFLILPLEFAPDNFALQIIC